MKSIRCVADHIFVLPADPKERTEGGIYIPAKLQQEKHEKAFYGRVLSVGPDAEDDIAVGDVVLFDVHRSEARVIDGPPNKKATLFFFIRVDAVMLRLSKEAALAWGFDYPDLKPIRELCEMIEDQPIYRGTPEAAAR